MIVRLLQWAQSVAAFVVAQFIVRYKLGNTVNQP